MTLDILGGKKNTLVNNSSFVVFEEMLSNAIDSYLIRRDEDNSTPQFRVDLRVEIIDTTLFDDVFDDAFDIEVTCTDNGAGFADEQVEAFVTKDSTYKDQLRISGIGKCKGAGRIQYFHHFRQFALDSVFTRNGSNLRRVLSIDESTRKVTNDSFAESDAKGAELCTKVSLRGRRVLPKTDPTQISAKTFAAHAVADHLYTAFLQRLIILKGLIGQFSINVESARKDNKESASIHSDSLPEPIEVKVLPLVCIHNSEYKTGPSLKISRYSFDHTDFPTFQHEVALCANSAVVRGITRHFLKKTADWKKPINGHFELLLVESDLLESTVNQQRDGFNIPAECSGTESLDGDFSLEDIFNSLEDYVHGVLAPKDFDRAQLVRATEKKFGITQQMVEIASVKIHYGDTEESIASRVLKKLQEDIVDDTSTLHDVKTELLKLDPRSKDFRAKVNELSWKYTSTIKKVDMANLSQLVVRRSAMIDVLRHAVKLMLDCQEPVDGKRNANERIIHNIFFPMGKDNADCEEHDIWLLNEEYQYFNYIASDKPLSSLTLPSGQLLFQPDVDETLARLFAENNTEHADKRPDIAIFNEEGAAIIIEFKAPDVEIQDHINDIVQYARLLAAKSNGRIKKFYGYLVGTKLNHSRMPGGWTRFPTTKGYFQTIPLEDPETGQRYGELYSELLFYDQFIDRADLRLGVYKERLKLR